MIPIYICEDNLAHREHLEKLINNHIVIEDYDMEIVLSTHSPDEILAVLDKNSPFGIYFLDIDLGNYMNGLELAVRIRKCDPSGSIIFITTHDEMRCLTFQYKVEAMDYIIKDNAEELSERVGECLAYAIKKLSLAPAFAKPTLCIKMRSKEYFIPFDDVYFIETSTNQHRLIIYKKDGSMEFYGNLESIIEQTGDSFLRSHRSCLVNKSHILEIDKKNRQILLKNGYICKMR